MFLYCEVTVKLDKTFPLITSKTTLQWDSELEGCGILEVFSLLYASMF